MPGPHGGEEMTIKDDLKAAYPAAQKIRLALEQRGRDPDALYTLLIAILQELRTMIGK